MDRGRARADHGALSDSATHVFTSGPRLTDGVDGDPRRQAVASLRGYAYQLYASALAWFALQPAEELHLEVAEDYAILSQGALDAVQVRDTPAAGGLTLRSAGVAQTIDSFVDLSRRNPDRRLTIRYLTTAAVAAERAVADRPAGKPGLSFWRQAAAGADVGPLREVLGRLDLSAQAVQFIAERDDDALRADLLQRIHWDAGAADLAGLRRELEAAALALGERDAGGYAADDVQRAVADVLDAVLSTAVSDRRVLTRLDLTARLEHISHISIPRRQLDALMQGAREFQREEPWRREDETPMPVLLAPRTDAVVEFADRVRRTGMAFAWGATGMGKSLVARLTAQHLGGDWMIADFAGLDDTQAAERLAALLGAVAVTPCAGVILDDLNATDTPAVATRLSRLRVALQRRDRLCLVTAYRPPAARLSAELALTKDAQQEVLDLVEDEVAGLVTAAGASATKWARIIFLATACGHPQLTLATIADLQWRGWPAEELRRLYDFDWTGLDLAAQRTAARRRLVDTAPEPARALLARLSLLIGSFRREIALELGGLAPPIASTGEHLDALTGPWIDRAGSDRLRISPLLSDAGTSTLTRDAQMAVHRAAADLLLGGRSLNVQDANAGLGHALAARSPEPLRRLAVAVIGANSESRARLAGWFSTLQLLRPDAPIFPEDPELSRLLRLAQVLLVAASDDGLGLTAKLRALYDEVTSEPDVRKRERLEVLILAKVLLERRLAETPDWVAMLARLDVLLETHPDLEPTAARREFGDPIGFFLNNLIMGVQSVAALADAFAQLDALPERSRGRLLARLRDRPEEAGYAVSHPWVAERHDNEIDGRPRAETYLSLARQAAGWGETQLAVRCHVARSIMLDEYADDEAGAMAALQLAEDELGPNLAISRARAKVAYRRRRHGDALALMREVMQGGLRQDAVERMFLCREAAISASEIGAWNEALDWFRQALTAAEAVKSDTLQVGVVGLRADVALAEWRCGNHDVALRCLWAALEAARDIDPDGSLKATYLHKVMGHACLWLFGDVTREPLPLPNGDPCIAPPGLCSNPEPHEDIRTLPRAPLEGSHYLLAIVDIHRGGALGFDEALTKLLGDRHIFTFECQRRMARLDRAVATLDLGRLPVAIGQGVEAMGLGIEVMRPQREPSGELPLVSGSFPRLPEPVRLGETAQSFVNDALFAVELLADLRAQGDAAQVVAEVAATLVRAGYAAPTYGVDPTTRQAAFLNIWRQCRATTPPLAEDLFTTGLRMIEWAKLSAVGRAVLPDLGVWAVAAWPQVLAQQRFRLRNPAVTVPGIEAAMTAEMSATHRLGAILAAARPAFKFNLGPDMIALLTPPQPQSPTA